jgi:hypothetical protein
MALRVDPAAAQSVCEHRGARATPALVELDHFAVCAHRRSLANLVQNPSHVVETPTELYEHLGPRALLAYGFPDDQVRPPAHTYDVGPGQPSAIEAVWKEAANEQRDIAQVAHAPQALRPGGVHGLLQQENKRF